MVENCTKYWWQLYKSTKWKTLYNELFSQTISYIFRNRSIASNVSSASGRYTEVEKKWEAKRATGLPFVEFTGYIGKKQYNPTGWNVGDPVQEENKGARLEYQFTANGTKKLILAVYWPFFQKASIWIELNGQRIHIDGNEYDWNPFMQTQEKHFIDLGTFDFSGTNTIKIIGYDNFDETDSIEKQEIGSTNEASIFGFVVCSDFEYNMRGGEVKFPTSCYPMKKRGNVDADGVVEIKDAQYPDAMRIVGEVLTRTPRPAIIWEDIFASYTDVDTPSYNILKFDYYTPVYEGGFTVGNWNAILGDGDYDHAFNDSRANAGQFLLNKKFSSNIAVDIEVRVDENDKNAIYGIRGLATNGSSSGYACVLNFAKKTVEIIWESKDVDGTQLPAQTIATTAMSSALANLNGSRFRLRLYVLNGKLSFWVEKKAYFDRIDMPHQPASGAYGIYNKNGRMKAYKYNVSTLDRFERMERIEVITGGNTYYFDEVERKPETTYDEFGLIGLLVIQLIFLTP